MQRIDTRMLIVVQIIFQTIGHVQADKTASLLAELFNMIGFYFIDPINHIQTLGEQVSFVRLEHSQWLLNAK